MAKIVGGKFTLLWTASQEADVVGYQVFFGPTPDINYDSPAIYLEGKDLSQFNSADLPADFELPGDFQNNVAFAKIGAVDAIGNISDLSSAVLIPFDATPPSMVKDFRLG
jgi:hypothetical protein